MTKSTIRSKKNLSEQEQLAMKKAAKELKVSPSSFLNSSNSNQYFIWWKKIARDGIVSLDGDFSVKRQKQIMADLEKVRRLREQRAIEKARHQEEMASLARDRARAGFQDWEKKEEEFLFHQSRARSEIRLRKGRVKPIDLLYKQLHVVDAVLDEPSYMVFKGFNVQELDHLRHDIKLHLDFDRATPTHIQYWEALLAICDWELGELTKKKKVEEERGLHSSIEADVKEQLQGKSRKDLVALQILIESKMRSGTAKVVEYWEAILKRLPIYIAKACLTEIHTDKLLRMHLERPDLENEDQDSVRYMDDPEETHEDEGAAGSFSPELLHGDDNKEVTDPEEDRFLLERNCMAVVEVNLDSQEEMYWWHDQYRPRKPKYFNRVHTGYEWNKYNRTHYDHDNPPPKTAQGYKFNICYPDLVHKATAPKYTIEKDGSNSETCIIIFQAGAPYIDIAFKIVSKEWDFSRKNGFKSTFEGGVLHVHFNFKRHCYRR